MVQSSKDYESRADCISAAIEVMTKQVMEGKPVPRWGCVKKGVDT
jgi:hypothetical protein